ncbi:unnamed protein product [Heterobilharzia americana]|nr:unnamed protein product [Heterobilharzia americana]
MTSPNWFDNIGGFPVELSGKTNVLRQKNVRISAKNAAYKCVNLFQSETARRKLRLKDDTNADLICRRSISHLLSMNFGLDEVESEEGLRAVYNSCVTAAFGGLLLEE